MPVNDDQPLLIDTQSGLNTLCDKLASATQLYCDTEFVRTQTYWPTLCLVQIAGNGTSGANAQPLHSADYDFNDDLLVPGSSFWVQLVEQELKRETA